MAAHQSILNRRSVLAALAAAPAVALPALAIAAEPHPDARLLDLGRKLEAAWAAQKQAADLLNNGEIGDDEYDPIHDATGEIVDQIETIPRQHGTASV
jgi:hypothetical protein